MSTLTSIFTVTAGLLYTAVLVTSFVLAHIAKPQTYRHLVMAVKWTWIALTIAALTFLLNLLAGDGWVNPVMWAFSTFCSGYILHAQCKMRDRKGEQLVDDALEQLDEWRWRS